MTDLERKKLQMQIIKCDAAVAELEYKIEERLADIERIKEHIELQKQNKKDMENKLNG